MPLVVRHAAASLLALPLCLGISHAAPAVQLGYGFDETHHVQKAEVAMLWDSGFAWGNPQGWLVDLQWEVNIARWNSSSDNNPHDLWEFGASPVVPVTTRPSEPFSTRWPQSDRNASRSSEPSARNGVTTAVRTSPSIESGL